MEWNKPAAYQVPDNQLPLPQQLRRQLRPQYWNYDDDEDAYDPSQRDDMASHRFAVPPGALAAPPTVLPFKADPTDTLGNNNSLLQPLSSLAVPTIDEPVDFQQFFTPQNSTFPDAACLSPIQQLQNQQQQVQQRQYGQLSTPLAVPQFSPLPPAMANVYALPIAQHDDQPSEEYLSEDSVPTLPLSFPDRQAPDTDTPPASSYTPRAAAIANNKRLLSDPFVAMPTVREPKFSPDRRKLCSVEGCNSQARAFNRCKRHGGSKRCSHPGCTKSVQSRGLCIRHGGGSRCQEPECNRASQSHGKCKMHGGGRPCIVEGCEKKAHLKRLCRKHGGGAKCTVPGCDKWAQREGMCMTHFKVRNSSDADDAGAYQTSAVPVPPPLMFFDDNLEV